MIGLLLVAYILIGFVAYIAIYPFLEVASAADDRMEEMLKEKKAKDAEKIIEEKIRENKAELDEILNKLDR